MRGLAGKNVLITGASSGIGQAIAVRFAEEGANVAVNYRSDVEEAQVTEKMIREATSRDVKVALIKADVTVEAEVKSMVAETIDAFGGVDILINNAGIQIASESHELSIENFDKVIAVNLRGSFMAAQSVIQHFLKESKPGSIINISSIHQIVPKPRFVGYSVSKGGMQNLTRTLALEYAGRGIRVNGIGPGATATPINRAWIDDPIKRQEVTSHIPLGRVAETEEMGRLAAFLCSDDAQNITGQTIFTCGGLTLYPDFREAWSSE